MNKILDIIVKKRYLILGLFVGLAIGCLLLFSSIKINYDTTKYLEKGSTVRESLEIMEKEFGSNGSFQVMVDNVTAEEADIIKNKLMAVENIESVLFNVDSENNYHDGYALYTIFLKVSNFDNKAKKVISTVENELDGYTYHLNGGAIDSVYLSDSVNSDMYKILVVAMIIVLIILIINSISWIEPVIFLIVIGICIVINMGSNAFLPNISFVTGSICAVMQLALSMDYSIMLLHSYVDEKENNPSESDSINVKNALRKSVVPILSSSLTTVAGLFALALMKFKIGLDIGVVLAKGIMISLITVIFFMPGLLLMFSKLIDKTKHRSLYQIIKSKFPTMENKIANYQYKSRHAAIIILAILIVVGFIFYTKADYSFFVASSNNPNSKINQDAVAVEEQYGIQNTTVIIVPRNEEEKEKALIEYLSNFEYQGDSPFTSIQGITTIGINDELTASDLATKYGLSIDLVQGVYESINPDITETDKLKVMDVLNYLNDSTYVVDFCNDLQNTFDNLYELSLHLDDVVDKATLSNIVSNTIGFTFTENNAQALIAITGSSLTFKETLYKVYNDKIIRSLYDEYKEYVNVCNELNTNITKADVVKYLIVDTDKVNLVFGSNETITLKYLVDNLNAEDVENEDDFLNYSFVSNSMNDTFTKEEAMNSSSFNYNILPSELFLLPYLLKSELTNLELQRSISNRLEDYIDDIDLALGKIVDKLGLLNEELTANDIGEEFSIPSNFIENIFAELRKEKLTGSELLNYISANDYISLLGGTMKETFKDLNAQMDYANKMFISENYTRIIINMKYSKVDKESANISKILKSEIANYFDEYYIASDGIAFADFEETFLGDSVSISLISFLFILLIIAISYRSIIVAIILPSIIQGAIWFTMAINVWWGNSVYFICYLMIVCIQMGTTVDYGILYTSNYLSARKENDIKESLAIAFKGSISTIITSGSILIVAAFVVGIISQVSIISSIGYLLSVGSLISVIFILFALPQVLIVCDKLIQKTTLKRKKS